MGPAEPAAQQVIAAPCGNDGVAPGESAATGCVRSRRRHAFPGKGAVSSIRQQLEQRLWVLSGSASGYVLHLENHG
ncbi:hypothetical protein [Streptomyces sp. VNUA24]|uniref:hypothetical protein n=1 Tax=Streptomyces sp. VNUA24 TaxID=3031131 RepID=UPI0023B8573E|nr:hypothetical protein [Streptomyces sp. VNUA24]WEH13047.1 hypothetical protein PYR72_04740 [Streptomyces sp. VNUA24]